MKNKKILPPQAPQKPVVFNHHGIKRTDSYFWLRDRKNKATLPYLEAENKYFEQEMAPLQTLKNKLYKEMRARLQENDSSVPSPNGPYEYYTKYKKGLQYPIECRRLRGAKNKKEEILLDQNRLAKGKKYFDVSQSQTSPDHSMLAYTVDTDGSEKYQIHFKYIKGNKLSKNDSLENSSGSFVWAADNKTIFYVVLDKNLRPFQVKRHTLGTSPKKDVVVYEERNPEQFIYTYSSSSEDYIFVGSFGKITSEIYYVSAQTPNDKLRLFEKRKEGIEYDVDHHKELGFIIKANTRNKNHDLFICSTENTSKKNWNLFYKTPKGTFLDNHTVFARHIVTTERANGLPQVRVISSHTKKAHLIKFPDVAYNVSLAEDNYEYDTDILRLNYSSPITPNTLFAYHLTQRTFKKLKQKKVKGHVPSKYTCKRVWVKSHDGAKVPLTLVFRKSLTMDGKAPGYLYGYGSYGHALPDAFPSYRDLYRLIDRGFVYALAHIRGGSEMGQKWYDDGKFLKKKNTFKDFIACAEYLQAQKIVAKDKLAIAGGSAGGMLVGACLNLRPELYKVAVAHVPFVDVVNTMLDKSLPLTQTEYKEWGNPADKKYFKYMLGYSPYDNVTAKDYPHLFVTCGLNDPRVTYWEPAKWVAKLRELKTDSNQILFKTNMGAGHFGQSGRFEYLWENAEEYAYILHQMEIKK